MNTISLDLARRKSKWTNEDFIREIISDAGCSYLDWNNLQPNKPLTDLGSTILHLLTLNPYTEDLSVSEDLICYVLQKPDVDINAQDKYGRTPLVNFMYCARIWQANVDYSISGLKLLLENGANPDLLFTPQFVHLAKCQQWALIHHCHHAHTLFGVYGIPTEMTSLLNQYWDFDMKDSAGRTYLDFT